MSRYINSTIAAFQKDIAESYLRKIYDSDTPMYFPLVYTKNSLGFPINSLGSQIKDDENIIKTITKYYYYKIVDKWFYKDFMPLLAFITNDENHKIVKNIKEFNSNLDKLLNESDKEIEKKIDFIEENLLSKNMVRHIIKKFVKKRHINWSSLNKYENDLQKKFFKYIKNKLEKNMKE
jgi:uncharacterized membrane-anchored protein YjiN (DUF445 family)